jgi:hypothetical protein
MAELAVMEADIATRDTAVAARARETSKVRSSARPKQNANLGGPIPARPRARLVALQRLRD